MEGRTQGGQDGNEYDTKKVKSCLPGWETVHFHIKDKDNIHCKF